MSRAVGAIGAAWGLVGVCAILGFAIYRLAPRAAEAWRLGLTPVQWGVALAVCVFMAYAEGYRGFQVKFSPRTAARIRYLRDSPNLLHSALGPIFAMGFFHATRKTRIVAYTMTVGIVILVLLVHRLDQPWRGIVDAGVVIGLTWGVVSLVWLAALALTRPAFYASPEVPGSGTRPVA